MWGLAEGFEETDFEGERFGGVGFESLAEAFERFEALGDFEDAFGIGDGFEEGSGVREIEAAGIVFDANDIREPGEDDIEVATASFQIIGLGGGLMEILAGLEPVPSVASL